MLIIYFDNHSFKLKLALKIENVVFLGFLVQNYLKINSASWKSIQTHKISIILCRPFESIRFWLRGLIFVRQTFKSLSRAHLYAAKASPSAKMYLTVCINSDCFTPSPSLGGAYLDIIRSISWQFKLNPISGRHAMQIT